MESENEIPQRTATEQDGRDRSETNNIFPCSIKLTIKSNFSPALIKELKMDALRLILLELSTTEAKWIEKHPN